MNCNTVTVFCGNCLAMQSQTVIIQEGFLQRLVVVVSVVFVFLQAWSVPDETGLFWRVRESGTFADVSLVKSQIISLRSVPPKI